MKYVRSINFIMAEEAVVMPFHLLIAIAFKASYFDYTIRLFNVQCNNWHIVVFSPAALSEQDDNKSNF